MPYMICYQCQIYYEIENKGEMNDFNTCKCGNVLKFYDTIEDYLEEADSATDEEGKGIFYSIDKKKLVNMEMFMLKDQKDKEEIDRSIRDLKYRIRHIIAENRKKLEYSEDSHKIEDENLKKKKKKLLRELEQLKKSHQ